MDTDDILRQLIEMNKDGITENTHLLVIYFHRHCLSYDFVPIDPNKVITCPLKFN